MKPKLFVCLWLISSVAACSPNSEPALETVEFVLPTSGVAMGAEASPNILVEFGDHLCPACRRLNDSVMPRVDSQFLKSSKIQYRYIEAGPANADKLAAFV